MIKHELFFTIEDGVKLLKSFGFDVKKQKIPTYIKYSHIEYEQDIEAWTVMNPNNQKYILVEDFFKKFLEKKTTSIFLQTNKLELINLFDK